MRNTGPLLILIVTCLCFSAALALIIAGTVGSEWLKGNAVTYTTGMSIGLWKTKCSDLFQLRNSALCYDRPSVLKYKSSTLFFYGLASAKSRDFDIVLTCLIVSCSFGALAFFLSLGMFACLGTPSMWKAASGSLALVGLTAAGTGWASVIYAEVVFKSAWDAWYEHGWSIILAWIGSGLFFIASVLAFIMLCVAPEPPISGVVMRQAPYGQSNPGYGDMNTYPMQDNQYAPKYKY